MGSYPPMYICHESLGRPSSTCPTILLVLRLFPVILIFYVAWRYFVRMVSTCFARVVAHGSDSFQPRHTSISDTGVPRSMAKNLLTTLIVTVYFPEVALLPDGMIIENSLISDATLEHLIEQFDGEEHKTLFALYAQFNSTLVARYCRTVVELVFDFLSDDDRELWFKGLSRSLEALTPRRRTEATVLLNNPEASRAEVEAAGEVDRALTTQIDAMVGRTPQLLVSLSKKVPAGHADHRKDEMWSCHSHSSRRRSQRYDFI